MLLATMKTAYVMIWLYYNYIILFLHINICQKVESGFFCIFYFYIQTVTKTGLDCFKELKRDVVIEKCL